MSKRELCQNCGRYTAEQKKRSSPNLKCDYCGAEIERKEIQKGCLFRKTVGYEVVKVKGGEKWQSNWRKVRQQAIDRAKNTCEKCKTTGVSLDVHHKKLVSKGGKDDLSNLMALCESCHKKEHARRW